MQKMKARVSLGSNDVVAQASDGINIGIIKPQARIDNSA
jgi:hypothetical protein